MPRSLTLISTALCLALSCSAAKEKWTISDQDSFKGEAAEAIGPFGSFSISRGRGRLVPFDQLKLEDLQRFARALQTAPQRAPAWADAKGELTKEILSHFNRIRNKKLTHDDATGVPEPEMVLIVQATAGNGDSWKMLGNAANLIRQLKVEFPGKIEGIFLGYGHGASGQIDMPATMGWEGLVAEYNQQPSSGPLRYLMPEQSSGAVLASRRGNPLIVLEGLDDKDLSKFETSIRGLLRTCSEDNPASWKARHRYLMATRPLLFAKGSLPAKLIGPPLRKSVLAELKVRCLDAEIEVLPSGLAGIVRLTNESVFPEELREVLASSLAQSCLFVPALRDGAPIPSIYHYRIEIDSEAQRPSTADLLSYKVIIPEKWLVLRPLLVNDLPEQAKLEINSEKEDGTVLLKPVYVGANLSGAPSYEKQRLALLKDWFDEKGGPISLHPAKGKEEVIWDKAFHWEEMPSQAGMVDLQEGINKNWVLAYAYTEIDAPYDMNGYIGLGTDDGARLWVNGALVHEVWANRPAIPNQDLVKVHLKQGKNKVLLKVQNFLQPGWAFHLQAYRPE